MNTISIDESDLHENAVNVLAHLREMIDPQTTDELMTSLDMTRRELVTALAELRNKGLLADSITGHKAIAAEQEPATPAPEGKTVFEKIVFLFAVTQRRLFPSTISRQTGLSNSEVVKHLAMLLDAGYIEIKNPATYYLTNDGLTFIQEKYPQITIPEYVKFNVQNPVPPFTVKASRHRTMPLKDVGQKIELLRRLIPHCGESEQLQMKELIVYLEPRA